MMQSMKLSLVSNLLKEQSIIIITMSNYDCHNIILHYLNVYNYFFVSYISNIQKLIKLINALRKWVRDCHTFSKMKIQLPSTSIE